MIVFIQMSEHKNMLTVRDLFFQKCKKVLIFKKI